MTNHYRDINQPLTELGRNFPVGRLFRVAYHLTLLKHLFLATFRYRLLADWKW